MTKESESKYPSNPVFKLDQRASRQYVRQWSEELDEFLMGSITELDNFIIKKMHEEKIPGRLLGIIQQEAIERFKAIELCNRCHEILQKKLNLDIAPTLMCEYVNDTIDLGKTLLPLLPKKEDQDFLKVVMDIDVFGVACVCGDLDLIKAAYEQAKNEDLNFSLLAQFDHPPVIAESIAHAWVERHWDVVDWLLKLVKTETDDEEIHYLSIFVPIQKIIYEERCNEFTYLWRQFSNTQKQRFAQSLIERSDHGIELVSYLALTDRNTLDELVKLAVLEDEEDPSQAFIFSLFKIGFQSKSFTPEVIDVIYEYASKTTKERLKNALMEIENNFSADAGILEFCENKDSFEKIIALFLGDLPIERQKNIAHNHLLSYAIFVGNVEGIVAIWNSYDKDDQKRLIIDVFSIILARRVLSEVDAEILKNAIGLLNVQIQEFNMQEDLETHLHSPDFSVQNRTQAYLIWLLHFDRNNSEACRIINHHRQSFFPSIYREDLIYGYQLLFPMICERMLQCYTRIFDNSANVDERWFAKDAKKMLEKTLMKVMCADNQSNDCLYNLVSHVLNKISNPKSERRRRSFAFSKARELLCLMSDLVVSCEEDPILLQCQLVSSILQNRVQNSLLTNAKFGGHTLISKFKTKLFNPFDGQPSRSTTEDLAILLYQSLEKKYSTELKYHDYFPTVAIKLYRP